MLIALAGCASEVAARNPQVDPTSAQAAEAPPAAAPELPRNDPTLVVSEPKQPPPPAAEEPHHHETTPATQPHHHESSPPAKPKSQHEHHVIYTCPMHPEVQSDKPGKCPKCGMTLVEKASP
jgi:hypothetical protein